MLTTQAIEAIKQKGIRTKSKIDKIDFLARIDRRSFLDLEISLLPLKLKYLQLPVKFMG